MNPRQHAQAIVADYLARGGTIHRLPEARPPCVADVIEYLREHDVDVAVNPDRGGRCAYLLRGEPISLERLVRVANRHRRRANLLPFDLAALSRPN